MTKIGHKCGAAFLFKTSTDQSKMLSKFSLPISVHNNQENICNIYINKKFNIDVISIAMSMS